MSEHDPPPDDNVLDPAMLVGVWANGTRVHRGRDELTVDFVRRVPESDASFLVARTLLPLVAAFELRDELLESCGATLSPILEDSDDRG